MEMEMEQLLSMGFPNDLAAKALSVTGGDISLAADWILNQTQKSPVPIIPNPNPRPYPSPPPFQPKINRFFQFKSKSTPPPSKPLSQSRPQPTDARRREEIESAPRKLQKCETAKPPPSQPLSERMRPRNIDEVVGQDHLLAKSSLLRSAIHCDRLPSMILWGPPGTGKTSIARAIVNSCSSSSSYRFVSLSAVSSGVKEVREVVDEARRFRMKSNTLFANPNKKKKMMRTVLFVDEVHRFNKSQQDSFLPVIEDGTIVFMGATTENPSFHLTTPLLSRCKVLKLNPLSPQNVAALVRRAVADLDKGLSQSLPPSLLASSSGVSRRRVEVDDDAIEFYSSNCDGDARVALNALEVSAITAAARSKGLVGGEGGDVIRVGIEDAKEAFQCKHLAYDKGGEEHYNLISALHKSMRGSDANASIYWLARMLEGGEKPMYIARRLVRFASEDVGLADSLAITQAMACYQACHFLGETECNANLAQCVAYLALAPKCVAVYKAIGSAQKVVRDSIGQNKGVPLHLRNVPAAMLMMRGDHPSSSKSNTNLPPSLQDYKFLRLPGDPNMA